MTLFNDLFANGFWFSSLPVLLISLLAGLVIVINDWRVGVPALLATQLTFGAMGVQRGLIPGRWAWVLAGVLLVSLLVLVISLLQTRESRTGGRMGGLLFRGLLLGLAAFLLTSREVGGLLPVLDEQMIRLSLWLGICGLIGLATGEDVPANSLALLLWLVSTEIALIAIAPAAVVVVMLGALFLMMALACGYLLLADDLTLAEERRPLTDVVFPAQSEEPQTGFLSAQRSPGTIARSRSEDTILQQHRESRA